MDGTPAIERKPAVPARGRGRVLLFTGDGKGKTTAALGLLFRASGHGLKGVMFSFVKSADRKYGEHRAAERSGSIEIVSLGDGFTWLSENIAEDRARAGAGWKLCRKALADETYDVVVLDEITYPVLYGWLDALSIAEAIGNRPPNQHVVMTGRDATEALVSLADTVTEMREVKHAFRDGVPASKGVEL